MIHWLHSLVRMYPYWSIPVILFCLELTRHYYRRASVLKWHFGFLAIALSMGLGAWIAFRGDLNADRWVESWVGTAG